MGNVSFLLLAPQGLLIYTFGNLRSIYRFNLANMAISGTTGHVTLMLLCFYSMYENLNLLIVIFSGCTVMHSNAQSMYSKAQLMHSQAQKCTVKHSQCTVNAQYTRA